MKTEVIERIVNSPSDRRKFIKRVGATGIGVAAATMLGGSLGKVQAANAITDADILNFALNLEYLEAEFYSMATYGSTLLELGVLTAAEESGLTTGGNMVPDFGSAPLAFLATALRQTEIDHVKYLRTALGSAAVKKPTINLNALGYGFSSVDSFLKPIETIRGRGRKRLPRSRSADQEQDLPGRGSRNFGHRSSTFRLN